MAELTFAELVYLIKYDPETGILTWLPRPLWMFKTERECVLWHKRFSGKEALKYATNGYKAGKIHGHRLLAHRVAWLLHYGKWPDKNIDHLNGDRSDNKIQNLRDVDAGVNQRNRKMSSRNTSGFTGVKRCKKTRAWIAFIRVNGKNKILGRYNFKEDAIRSRERANTKYGYTPRHGRKELPPLDLSKSG